MLVLKRKTTLLWDLLLWDNNARVGNVQYSDDNILEDTLRMTSRRNYLVDGKALIGNSDRILCMHCVLMNIVQIIQS